MRQMKLWSIFVLFYLSITAVHPFWHDKELDIIHGVYAKMPVAIRHVEFIGTADNGTLDCFVPGFTQYRWELINKASSGPYAESSSLVLDGKIKEHQSTLKIGKGGFPLATEMLVVSCELMLNDRPKFQILWVVTRLHSPLGYPTDPRICTFNVPSFYEVGCDRYKWTHSTDCYSETGKDYRGEVYLTKSNPPTTCQYWFQNMPNSGSSDFKVDLNKEHRYCRNPNNEYSPWCFTTSTKHNLRKQSCRVQECSDCMYGNGDGNFDLYDDFNPISKWKRKLPEYKGRIITTVKDDEKGRPRLCMSGKGWEWNLCRPREGKAKPHCFIAKDKSDEPHIKHKWDDRLELVECRIPQCTVRQVWFLFFDSNANPYYKESNFQAAEMVVVHGESVYFFFYAFGIHQPNGLSVGSDDPKLAKFARKFVMKGRAPPDRFSTVTIYNLHREMTGNYFIQYTFVEGDPRIQQSTFKGNFGLDVRYPMSLSIKPAVLEVCKGQRGSLSIEVSGGFKVWEDTLKWKYGNSKNSVNNEISVDDSFFELSADFRKLSIKEMKKDTWITVEGGSYSGKASTTAQFKLKDQPHLIATSPSQVFALPGDEVSLSLEKASGLRTRWTFDAQLIPDVPDDPDMAFERGLKDKLVTETLVISSLDWRHFGVYAVETEKDGCREETTFHIQHDKEREINEELNSTSVDEQENGEIDSDKPIITKSGKCNVQQLTLTKHDKRSYASNWTMEVPCHSKEEEGVTTYDHGIEELSPCSVITGYSFTTRAQRPYKLLISANETQNLEEYTGDVNVKTSHIQSNNDEAWVYNYYFNEPVAARLVQFVANQVEDSKCLFGLTLNGCSLVKSRCKPKSFSPDEIICGDRKSSLLNKEEVKKMASCNLISSYQFASNVSRSHKLLISGQNSMLLTEYDGDMQVETEFSEGEWQFFISLTEPVPARYVQFVPDDDDGGSLMLNNLQITGCRLDKHWCTLDWSTFREVGLKCDENQLTPIYSEHPVLELPACSLITNYQFIGKSTKNHALLLSGNNPALLRNFKQGLDVKSYYYRDDEWVFVCTFAAPVAARYVQFICDATGNVTCQENLGISGCAVEESWCEEQSFETKIEEYYVRSDFLDSFLGRVFLRTTIASVLTPFWMFVVGKYNLDRRLVKWVMKLLKKFKRTSGPKKASTNTE